MSSLSPEASRKSHRARPPPFSCPLPSWFQVRENRNWSSKDTGLQNAYGRWEMPAGGAKSFKQDN